MKPFNLEEALKGQPCVTRNGDKAMVVFDKSVLSSEAVFPLVGYLFKNNKWVAYESTWKKDGACASSGKDDVDDIVGMWEEPPLEVTITVPASLKTVTERQEVWYLEYKCESIYGYPKGTISASSNIFSDDNKFLVQMLETGQLFATKEAAEKFLEALKGARR